MHLHRFNDAKRKGKYPKPSDLKTIQLDYLRGLRPLNRQVETYIVRVFLPQLLEVWSDLDIGEEVVQDRDIHADLLALFRSGLKGIENIIPSTKKAEQMSAPSLERAQVAATKDVAKGIQSITGINVLSEARPLSTLVDRYVKDNVALIKTLPPRTFEGIEKLTRRAYESGTRAEDLAQEIKAYVAPKGTSDYIYARIARDQIGKIRSEVRQERHQALGIEQFTWRAVGDDRTRDEHMELDGKVFAYNDPPSEGLPGEAIQCRCWDEPVIVVE